MKVEPRGAKKHKKNDGSSDDSDDDNQIEDTKDWPIARTIFSTFTIKAKILIEEKAH